MVGFAETAQWALRLVTDADAGGTPLRIFGSVAAWLHCPATRGCFVQTPGSPPDLDLVARFANRDQIRSMFQGQGLVPDEDVEATPGLKRSIFYRVSEGCIVTRVDLHYDELYFTHRLPVASRLEVDSPTIPLAELLLSKLQMREWKARDAVSVMQLLAEHPFGTGDREEINLRRVTDLCAGDWGLTRTVSENLERLTGGIAVPLDNGLKQVVRSQAGNLLLAISEVPKSGIWRARALIGRVLPALRWYAEVEPAGLPMGAPVRRTLR